MKELEYMELEELEDNPCESGYVAYGLKTKDGKEVPNCVPESYTPYKPYFNESEYQGRDVELNKPVRVSGENHAFHVYVKDGDKVKKVNFGDPDMPIRRSDDEARKSFNARHKCDTKKDKTKAGYWSCRSWDKGADWV